MAIEAIQFKDLEDLRELYQKIIRLNIDSESLLHHFVVAEDGNTYLLDDIKNDPIAAKKSKISFLTKNLDGKKIMGLDKKKKSMSQISNDSLTLIHNYTLANALKALFFNREKNSHYSKAEEQLECPISLETLINPVIALTSERSYEKTHIEKALSTKQTDPETRIPLTKKELVDNHALQSLINLLPTIKMLTCENFDSFIFSEATSTMKNKCLELQRAKAKKERLEKRISFKKKLAIAFLVTLLLSFISVAIFCVGLVWGVSAITSLPSLGSSLFFAGIITAVCLPMAVSIVSETIDRIREHRANTIYNKINAEYLNLKTNEKKVAQEGDQDTLKTQTPTIQWTESSEQILKELKTNIRSLKTNHLAAKDNPDLHKVLCSLKILKKLIKNNQTQTDLSEPIGRWITFPYQDEREQDCRLNGEILLSCKARLFSKQEDISQQGEDLSFMDKLMQESNTLINMRNQYQGY